MSEDQIETNPQSPTGVRCLRGICTGASGQVQSCPATSRERQAQDDHLVEYIGVRLANGRTNDYKLFDKMFVNRDKSREMELDTSLVIPSGIVSLPDSSTYYLSIYASDGDKRGGLFWDVLFR